MADYLTELFGLKGRVAVVIGGAGFLCGEMAAALVRAGVKVVVSDKDTEGLRRVESKLKDWGGEVVSFKMDVTEKADHEQALAEAVRTYGTVDILINGAGINAPTPVMDISRGEWENIIAVNLTGTLFGCQVFGKHMIERGRGSIINISSVSAGPPLSKAFTYSVTKCGVYNLTQNLAREWAPYNVRVNALRPGFFPTQWSMEHFIDEAREKAILGHTPMGRYGRPEELVGAVLWLGSDAASFVTGALITIDGGFTAMTI